MAGFTNLSDVLEESQGVLFFECPGCHMLHGVNVSREGVPKWTWNGSVVNPTFSPSILVQGDFGVDRKLLTCHSFVRDGRIEFLNDCTHSLAGKTVPMQKLSDWG